MKKVIGAVLLSSVCLFMFNACSTIPKGANAVKPFDKEKYLGTWYEIARLDFRYERDMKNVTATYSADTDGSIRVVNRGYNYKTNEWKEAVGKAKFVRSSDEAMLKVSFFGPFYSGYNVIAIDDRYTFALVAGKDLDYLWLLSREKTMPEDIKQKFLETAREIGYTTSALIWTQQDK